MQFEDVWRSGDFIGRFSHVIDGGFVTVERVVVLGDERSNERWFGLRAASERGGGSEETLYERCVPSKKLGEFAEPSRVGREKIGVPLLSLLSNLSMFVWASMLYALQLGSF